MLNKILFKYLDKILFYPDIELATKQDISTAYQDSDGNWHINITEVSAPTTTEE